MAYQDGVVLKIGAGTTAIARHRYITVTDGLAAVCDTDKKPIGVSTIAYDPARETTLPVCTRGVVEVEASAAIAKGAAVGSAADGRVRTAASGKPELGIALTAAGAAGEIVEILIA